MPLRALFETREIVAPTLDRVQWEALWRETHGAAGKLTLPCCGSRAFQRTSRRGLQHFYHSPDTECDERGETQDHLAAKLAIVQGCERAGFQPHPEWLEDGWRADILAVRGPLRIAFEVQWSRLSLEETVQRQDRYARAGVRGCWFFRYPPVGLRQPHDEQPLVARHDLPAFLLPHDPDGAPCVCLNGHTLPLDRFVAQLLSGKVRFRRRARIARWQPVCLRFYDFACWRCGGLSHVYCLDRRTYGATCGIEMPLHRGWFDASRPALRPEIQRAAWSFLLTDQGLNLRLGSIKPRTMGGRERMSFGCFWCDEPFPDYPLWHREDEVRRQDSWTATHRTVVRSSGPYTLHRPHWCLPTDSLYCL